tara:strand:+ start:666 stop:1745 length:1080 start_codon:yes stop_codon:yes gene_type:complete
MPSQRRSTIPGPEGTKDYPYAGLTRLEVVGSDDNAALIFNKTNWVLRGPKNTMLANRNSILTHRGFTAPEGWDLVWDKSIGPIWTPEFVNGVKTWSQSETIQPEDDNPTLCILFEDRLIKTSWSGGQYESDDEGVGYFHNVLLALPTIGEELNGFPGLEFDGVTSGTADYYLWTLSQAHLDISEPFQPGTGDYLVAFVLDIGPDQNRDNCVIMMNKDLSTWAILKLSNSTDKIIQITVDGADALDITDFDWDDKMILITTREGGYIKTYIDGDLKGTSASTHTADIDSSNYHFLGGATSGAINPFRGTIWEVLTIVEEAGEDVNDYREKIEGYLAHKYDLIGNLPSDHPYKTSPPRRTH